MAAIYKPSLLDKFKDFVNGLRSNWDIFETHQAESASDDVHNLISDGRVIEESGSNDYGVYVKFADGTLLMRSRVYQPNSFQDFNDLQVPYPYPPVGIPSGSFNQVLGTNSADTIANYSRAYVECRQEYTRLLISNPTTHTPVRGVVFTWWGRWK